MRTIVSSLIVVLTFATASRSSAAVLGSAVASASAEFAGVASVSGSDGTRWRTDVVLSNLDSREWSSVLLLLRGADGFFTHSVDLAPLAEHRIDDILNAAFGRSGLAIIQVHVRGSAVEVSIRTHDGAGCGAARGTLLTPVLEEPFVKARFGQPLVEFPVVASGPSRVNLGIGNFSSHLIVARWKLSDLDGTEIRSGVLEVGAGEMVQARVFDAKRGLPLATLEVNFDDASNGEILVFPYVAIVSADSNEGHIAAARLEGAALP